VFALDPSRKGAATELLFADLGCNYSAPASQTKFAASSALPAPVQRATAG
jgi:hypothetical protein